MGRVDVGVVVDIRSHPLQGGLGQATRHAEELGVVGGNRLGLVPSLFMPSHWCGMLSRARSCEGRAQSWLSRVVVEVLDDVR